MRPSSSVTVLEVAGEFFLEEHDETEIVSAAGRRENNTRLTIRRSRVDDSRSAALNLRAFKKRKLLPTQSARWVEQELIRKCSRAPRSLARRAVGSQRLLAGLLT